MRSPGSAVRCPVMGAISHHCNTDCPTLGSDLRVFLPAFRVRFACGLLPDSGADRSQVDAEAPVVPHVIGAETARNAEQPACGIAAG